MTVSTPLKAKHDNAPSTACPAWCDAGSAGSKCDGEHFGDAWGKDWPPVRATADPKGGDHVFRAHPNWGQLDGLPPAVALYIEGDVEKTIELTPSEALRLAEVIVRAARAVLCGERA